MWLFICALNASCFVGWVLFMFACWLSGLLVALLLLVVGLGWCLMIGVLLLRYCFVWFGLVLVGLEFVVWWVVGFFVGCVNSVVFVF